MALLLMAQTLPAAERPVIKTDWAGLQQQVPLRKFDHHNALVSLTTADRIKVNFLRVEEDGLVVVETRGTRQWATKNREARIPRNLVSGIDFQGKVGRNRTVLFWTGVGAGGFTTACCNWGCEGSVCFLWLLLIPVSGIAGYLAGRALDQPAPAFVIER
jgi:hypothetical protein